MPQGWEWGRYMIRRNFDAGWTVLLGDLDPTVPRNTAKTASSGGPSDLSLDEGGRLTLPERIAERLGDDLLREIMGGARSVQGTWDPVQLPDDWTTRTPPIPPTNDPVPGASAVVDPQVRGGYLPTGIAWYRKIFEVPAEWDGQRVRLDFDGVMRDAHIWVNGSFIGSHYSGYTGFTLDVTEFLRYGDEGRNVVLVRTDTSSTEGWWAEGGGIYRHVWLIVSDPIHVARHGVCVVTSDLRGERATLTISTEIDNDGVEQAEVVVEHVITTPNGSTVRVPATRLVVGPFESEISTCELEMAPVELWSLADPQLHYVSTEAKVQGNVVDEASTTFGIRTISYGPNGLLVNDVPTPIRGVCCHQDFAGVGVALPDRVHELKIALLRDMGCNAYRAAHHAPAPELLDACDRLGVLVLDENRRLESNPEGVADLTELIRRDRNHPCVFMWSLANEELIEGTPMSRRLLRRLVDLVHRLDPSRPTTAAAMFGRSDPEYMKIPDVAGFNYDDGASGHYREVFPGAPVMATEDTSFVSARGIYQDDPERGLTSSHDEGGLIERAEKVGAAATLDAGAVGGALATEGTGLTTTELNRLAHPYLGGVFVWTGFDYRGEAGPFGWPAVNASFGIMDLCGFPKDLWYYWHSRWSTDPVAHVLPHWNWESLEGQSLRVVTYSNCEEIELLVNGGSVAKKPVPETGMVVAAVTYIPGSLEVRGYRDGGLATSSIRETTGAPAALRLSTWPDTVSAGSDTAIVRVEVIDARGRVVPDACPELEFACNGGAVVLGSGNGSPADHVPAAAARRPAFNGLALAILRAPAEPGAFTVTVASAGLTAASLDFRAT
jgi:beta-galactosidase